MRYVILFAFCLLSASAARAAIDRRSIPRTSLKQFVHEGLFQGGTDTRANLESLRVAEHKKEGMERWVLDFSDTVKRKLGLVAPRFQLQYFKADRVTLASGREHVRKPAKFLILLRSINKNFVTPAKAKQLVQKSQYVKEIQLHPPIEEGDMAIEFILKEDVEFEAHQPIEREGRLVLDLRYAEESEENE